jgi:hypothetical protein
MHNPHPHKTPRTRIWEVKGVESTSLLSESDTDPTDVTSITTSKSATPIPENDYLGDYVSMPRFPLEDSVITEGLDASTRETHRAAQKLLTDRSGGIVCQAFHHRTRTHWYREKKVCI